MYELIFLDMDGTLKQEPFGISDINKEAVIAACLAGKKVSIASGRNKSLIMPTVKELKLDQYGQSYSVALNGAHIIDNLTGGTIHTVPLPFPLVKKLFDLAAQLGIHCHVYTENYAYFLSQNERYAWYDSQGCQCFLVDLNKDDLGISEIPLKVFIASDDHNELATFQMEAEKFTSGILAAEYSSLTSLEFTSIETSKGHGLSYVCNQFAWTKDNAIAMGDGENDLSMLKTAGLGVAMKNALDTVKAEADAVTERTCIEHGVAEIIYKKLLNQTDLPF